MSSKDVFISYSRRDKELCDQVANLIEKRLGYQTFVDRHDIAAGEQWEEALTAAIENENKPYVILLATRAAADRPDWIRKEIELARKNDLKIIPVEFAPGAAGLILENRDTQELDATAPDPGLLRLEKWLRISLHRRLERTLEGFREQAEQWANRFARRTRGVDFWKEEWKTYFHPVYEGHSMVLTADGGSGKSVLIAHLVKDLLLDKRNFPLILNEATLREGAPEIARLLAARNVDDLAEHLEELRRFHKERIVFIIDGLDQMVSPDDPGQVRLSATINRLIGSSRVVIGCRKVIWETTYAHLAIEQQSVEGLDSDLVALIISREASQLNNYADNNLLRIPLFLDLTLRNAEQWGDIPTTTTDFLVRIWTDVLRAEHVAPTEDLNLRERILDNLAALQIDRLTYDIPVDDLKRKCDTHDFNVGLDHLQRSSILQKKSSASRSTVRLAHDLLDNYGMVRLLLRHPDCRRELYGRFELDCGWSVMSILALVGHDQNNKALMREVFEALLFVIDRKKHGLNARAWAATYVLQERISELLPLIIECLGGEKSPPVTKDDLNAIRSSLSPARVTQEAASTLAAAFLCMDRGKISDVEWVAPVLAEGLNKWNLRGRFVEALSKYRHRNALTPIVALGCKELDPALTSDDLREPIRCVAMLRDVKEPALRFILDRLPDPVKEMIEHSDGVTPLTQDATLVLIDGLNKLLSGDLLFDAVHFREVRLRPNTRRLLSANTHGADLAWTNRLVIEDVLGDVLIRRDPEVLKYVAEGLGHFDYPEAVSLLQDICRTEAVGLLIRRAAFESLDRLRPGLIFIPEVKEDEIIQGLSCSEWDPISGQSRYSDWRTVQKYATVAANKLKAGELLTSDVTVALIGALSHDQTAVHGVVAQALGLVNSGDARDALLNEILKPSVSAGVHRACLEALRTQLRHLTAAGERQSLRVLLLRTAGEAATSAEGSFIAAQDLTELATDQKMLSSSDWLITSTAAEIIASLPDSANVTTKAADESTAPIEERILALLTEDDLAKAGPALETKYRFTRFLREGNDLSVEAVATTWPLGKGFHIAMSDDPARFSAKQLGGRLLPVPLGSSLIPGIAAVHVIVVTSDNKILLAQRAGPDKVAYYPFHWSASFEEQITSQDFDNGPNTLVAAACRGFKAEFGAEAEPANVRVLSGVIELETLNVALVVLLRAGETFQEIREAWLREPRPPEHWEAIEIDAVDRSLLQFGGIANAGVPSPLHPTTSLRFSMLARMFENRRN